jgi:hypothetical protein
MNTALALEEFECLGRICTIKEAFAQKQTEKVH